MRELLIEKYISPIIEYSAKVWKNNSGLVHSFNGQPAAIEFYNDDLEEGNIIAKWWYKNHKLYRKNGKPNYISYYRNGKVKEKHWYKKNTIFKNEYYYKIKYNIFGQIIEKECKPENK